MTAIIEVRGPDGKLKGKCDIRCYNAKCKKCTCVCGGNNHGVGLIQALNNISNLKDLVIGDDGSTVKTYNHFVNQEMNRVFGLEKEAKRHE